MKIKKLTFMIFTLGLLVSHVSHATPEITQKIMIFERAKAKALPGVMARRFQSLMDELENHVRNNILVRYALLKQIKGFYDKYPYKYKRQVLDQAVTMIGRIPPVGPPIFPGPGVVAPPATRAMHTAFRNKFGKTYAQLMRDISIPRPLARKYKNSIITEVNKSIGQYPADQKLARTELADETLEEYYKHAEGLNNDPARIKRFRIRLRRRIPREDYDISKMDSLIPEWSPTPPAPPVVDDDDIPTPPPLPIPTPTPTPTPPVIIPAEQTAMFSNLFGKTYEEMTNNDLRIPPSVSNRFKAEILRKVYERRTRYMDSSGNTIPVRARTLLADTILTAYYAHPMGLNKDASRIRGHQNILKRTLKPKGYNVNLMDAIMVPPVVGPPVPPVPIPVPPVVVDDDDIPEPPPLPTPAVVIPAEQIARFGNMFGKNLRRSYD
ncbi:hypothetical protein ACFLYA_02700 [Candidatus Dependentiae bacterium]